MARPKQHRRIRQAAVALKAYKALPGVDPDELVKDLMADLGHWCDRHGLDWEKEVRCARNNWIAEREK